MWLIFAALSALFAGVTAILAKCGIKNSNSDVVTALRTGVVLVFAIIMAFLTADVAELFRLSPKTYAFLILSGIATGASWLMYFKALQIGDVNKVVPIDKSSTVLTMILAFIFLGEPIGVIKFISIILISLGTYLMISFKNSEKSVTKGHSYMIYAFLSAIFASLTAILGKVGIDGVNSNLGTAVRTAVVLVMAWLVVFVKGEIKEVKHTDKKDIGFIILSGIATGASWLCYYRALKDGYAGVVVPIDKLSILVSIGFSYIVFGEKLSKKSAVGLLVLTGGTLLLIL